MIHSIRQINDAKKITFMTGDIFFSRKDAISRHPSPEGGANPGEEGGYLFHRSTQNSTERSGSVGLISGPRNDPSLMFRDEAVYLYPRNCFPAGVLT